MHGFMEEGGGSIIDFFNRNWRSSPFDGGSVPMLLFDALTIALGIFLIAKPDVAYRMGRGKTVEVPSNWRILSRVLGVLCVLLGLAFFLFDF